MHVSRLREEIPSGCWATKTSVNSSRPGDAYMCRQTNHHWFRKWLVAWTAPSHYLKQCWNIVKWTLGNKLQWNFNQNSNIFIHKNAFESVVCDMASILSRPQCVKHVYLRTCVFSPTALLCRNATWAAFAWNTYFPRYVENIRTMSKDVFQFGKSNYVYNVIICFYQRHKIMIKSNSFPS